MMKFNKNIIILLAILVISGIVYVGCEKDFLEKQPPSSLTEEIFYQTADDAVSAVNSVYAPMQLTVMYNRNYPNLASVPSDDEIIDNAPGGSFDNFTATALEGELDDVWQACYEGIFRANLVMQKVPEIDMDQGLKDRVIGEAKFLRAFYYWHLTTMFGDVPIITEADPSDVSKAIKPKSPKSEVYNLMIQDLTEAQSVLPPSYDDANLGRATKGAAQTLLGKIYLYDENYPEAINWFEQVIDSEVYELVDDYESLWNGTNENSEESIFELQFQDVGGSGWAGQDAAGNNEGNLRMRLNLPQGKGGFGNHLPTQDYVDEFEDYSGATAIKGKDPRRYYTVFVEGDLYDPDTPEDSLFQSSWTPTGYAMKKGMFPVIRGNTNSSRNFVLLRYADVLLMYAEALNENGAPEGDVLEPLNMVRNRPSVDMPEYPTAEYPTSTQQERFEAIVHERRVELGFEFHRYNDLRRWGLAEQELGSLGYTSKYRYFPIPQGELDVNPELEQNDAY